MSYILSGDSGTVVFDRTGTITNESPTMSSQVTSNPIEGGGKITDHAVLDPIKFSITGIVSTVAGYATLEAMWRNRDLLTYRGAEAFCDQVLYDALTKPFILDNYGSQVGKGTHFGLNRLRDFMREYYRRNGFSADGWVLKADVRHYFQSIRPDVLKKDVAKYLHDPDCLTLACQIIDSAPDPLGIPIGNQSSQIFALLYLNQLDHLCKEQLRFRYYGRYMDDFYIICESKQRLQEALMVIRQHLAERGLELNQKTNIFPLRNGLDFLGFHTYIDDAGRVIRKVRKSSRDRMKRKLRKYAALYQRGEIDREKIAESYTSWRAHALHGDCRQLVAKYDQQFLSIFERRPEHVQEDQHSGRGC